MFENKRARTFIIWLSICLSVIALGVYVYSVVQRAPNPVWNRPLLVYCAVFWVFLAFDELGRRVAEIGNAKRSGAPRPRPQPRPQADMPLPGQVPLEQGDSSRGPGEDQGRVAFSETGDARSGAPRGNAVGLQRIDESTRSEAQGMMDDCMREILALEGQVFDSSRSPDVARWMKDESTYGFVIMAGGQMVGVTAVTVRDDDYQLLCLYVKQEVRRQRFGSAAFAKVEEFVRLLGRKNSIRATTSQHNMRSVRFYKSVGMSAIADTTSEIELTKSLSD